MTPKITLTLLCALSLGACTSGPTWRRLPSLPSTISNNAVTSVVSDDRTTLFSFMGITNPADPATITAESFRLELPGGQWEPIADAPTTEGHARIGANAICVGNRVFLIGGYTVEDGEERTEKRLVEYLPASDEYVRRADVPVEVDDTVLGVYRDRFIYAISGWHGPTQTNVLDVQVYDTQTDSWQAATPMPAPAPGLFGHSGTIIGDSIIVCDGVAIKPTVDGRQFVISDRVFRGMIHDEDPTSIDWRELEPHLARPTYRGAASQGPSNGRMLLVGGTDNPYNINGIGYNDEPSAPLDQILVFDPANESWSMLEAPGLGTPTMDHRGLVRVGENSWAIIGGMVTPGRATGECWVLQLD